MLMLRDEGYELASVNLRDAELISWSIEALNSLSCSIFGQISFCSKLVKVGS